MSLDQRLRQAEREFRMFPQGIGNANRLHHLREQAAILHNEATIHSLKTEEKAKCPDGGTCHHSCDAGPCFRVRSCGPLSKVFPNDEWPAEVKEEHLRREVS